MMPRYCILLQKLVSSVHHVKKFSTAATHVFLTSASERSSPNTSLVVEDKLEQRDDSGLNKVTLKEYVSSVVTTTDQKLLPRGAWRVQYKRVPTRGFLVDPNVALSIKEIIQNQNPDLNATVIEINPGIGCLTKHLLTLGFTNVTLFEPISELASALKNKWPHISVINKPFQKLFIYAGLDNFEDSDHLGKLIETIKISSNSEHLYIVGLLTNNLELNSIISSATHSHLFYDGTYPWKNITYYFLLDSKAYTQLTSTPEDGFYIYRANSVLFQTLFSYECLGEFPRNCYLPWHEHDSSTRSKHIRYNQNVVYLLKFTLSDEILTELPVTQFLQYSFFIKRHLFARHNRVIPLLEKWIPDCGPRLIRDGFTIFSQFGDLSQSELFKLYCDFISFPGFPASSFHAASLKHEISTADPKYDDHDADSEHKLDDENTEYKLDDENTEYKLDDENTEYKLDEDDENIAYRLDEDEHMLYKLEDDVENLAQKLEEDDLPRL